MCVCTLHCSFFLFFFSSRRRHTRLQGDWSSDVCSSDLPSLGSVTSPASSASASLSASLGAFAFSHSSPFMVLFNQRTSPRSEERRVGKEWSSRRAPEQLVTK